MNIGCNWLRDISSRPSLTPILNDVDVVTVIIIIIILYFLMLYAPSLPVFRRELKTVVPVVLSGWLTICLPATNCHLPGNTDWVWLYGGPAAEMQKWWSASLIIFISTTTTTTTTYRPNTILSHRIYSCKYMFRHFAQQLWNKLLFLTDLILVLESHSVEHFGFIEPSPYSMRLWNVYIYKICWVDQFEGVAVTAMFSAAVVLFGLCTTMHTCIMTTATAVVHCAAVTHEWPASIIVSPSLLSAVDRRLLYVTNASQIFSARRRQSPSAALVVLLLLRAGVESNPGPASNTTNIRLGLLNTRSAVHKATVISS